MGTASPIAPVYTTLPSGYAGIDDQQCQMVYVYSYDSTGTTLGTMPGFIGINGNQLTINTTGMFNPDSLMMQGIQNSTTVIYQIA